MKKKVLVCVWVSSSSQIEKDGPERQRKAIRAYAKASNMEVLGFFEDLGVTGVSDCSARDGL